LWIRWGVMGFEGVGHGPVGPGRARQGGVRFGKVGSTYNRDAEDYGVSYIIDGAFDLVKSYVPRWFEIQTWKERVMKL